MKRKSIVGLIVVVAIVAMVMFLVCAEEEVAQREALLNCDITLSSIQMTELGLFDASVNLAITVNVYNPNAITATLDRIDYIIYANDIAIGTGCFSERTDIPPMKTEMITTSYRADLTTVPDVLVSGIQVGGITWKIGGIVYIDTPLGALEIPFEEEVAQI